MQTTDLIERLAVDFRPPLARVQLLGTVVTVGAVLALGLLWTLVGLRADLIAVLSTPEFWMKAGFTLSTAAAAFVLCARLSRPEGTPGWWPVGLALPFLALVAFACVEMWAAPPHLRQVMWVGQTALQCVWCIPVLAAPLLIGVLWAFRFFAPTRLRLAGFSGGLLAGATSAVIYALHCAEREPAFVATWYSAGILLPALLGWLFGPRVLRW